MYKDILSSWEGKKVAFIGDSITDGIGTTKTYHEILAEELGFTALNYGKNGAQVLQMADFAADLQAVHPDTDAVFVFGGTNDYNNDIEIGSFFDERVEEVNHDGVQVCRKRRMLNKNEMTFCGRLNKLLEVIKRSFPDSTIILMTPIHRGFAVFGSDNIQPCDQYANACGYYIDDYANAVKRAGEIWSVPVIDLFSDSGLLPNMDEYTKYFNNAETDRLHPNCLGHERLAQTIMGWLNVYACR